MLGTVGWTLPYNGVVDAGYPARLARAILELSQEPGEVERRRGLALDLSRRHYDLGTMQARLAAILKVNGSEPTS